MGTRGYSLKGDLMKKIVLKCPKCRKKMKISDKPAKYRCPHCKEVYKYTKLKQITGRLTRVFTGIGTTAKDIKNGFIYKYNTAKNTYKYMKSMKQNMKNNPNWSNYHKEQQEMKEMNKAKTGFKSFLNKFKRK